MRDAARLILSDLISETRPPPYVGGDVSIHSLKETACIKPKTWVQKPGTGMVLQTGPVPQRTPGEPCTIQNQVQEIPEPPGSGSEASSGPDFVPTPMWFLDPAALKRFLLQEQSPDVTQDQDFMAQLEASDVDPSEEFFLEDEFPEVPPDQDLKTVGGVLTALQLFLLRAIAAASPSAAVNQASLDAVLRRLSRKVLAEVQGRGLQVSSADWDQLGRQVFRSVCRKLACKETRVLSMIGLQSRSVDDVIVACVRKHLIRPSAFTRFCSAVAGAWCRPEPRK